MIHFCFKAQWCHTQYCNVNDQLLICSFVSSRPLGSAYLLYLCSNRKAVSATFPWTFLCPCHHWRSRLALVYNGPIYKVIKTNFIKVSLQSIISSLKTHLWSPKLYIYIYIFILCFFPWRKSSCIKIAWM